MKKLKRFVKTFFAYNCIACGKAVDDSSEVLCTTCQRSMFNCLPYKKRGIHTVIPYNYRAAKALILYMKDYYDDDAFRYSASLILHKLRSEGITNLDDYYITFAPRNPITRFKKEFDQSEEIAKRLSEELFGTPDRCMTTLTRSWFSPQQKTLRADERRYYIEKTLRLKKKVFLPQKLIVIDDVTTTGETLYAIRELFTQLGVDECILCSLAYNKMDLY